MWIYLKNNWVLFILKMSVILKMSGSRGLPCIITWVTQLQNTIEFKKLSTSPQIIYKKKLFSPTNAFMPEVPNPHRNSDGN